MMPHWTSTAAGLPSPPELYNQHQHQYQFLQQVQACQQLQQQLQKNVPIPTKFNNTTGNSGYKPRKKLRDSCNNCASSKVKCTKEHPRCQRCEDREIYCHYSPTRRAGKRRGTTGSQAQPQKSPGQRPGTPVQMIKDPTPTPPAQAQAHSGYFDFSGLLPNHEWSMAVSTSIFPGLSAHSQSLGLYNSGGGEQGNIKYTEGFFPDSLDPGLFSDMELDQLGLSLSPVIEQHSDMDVVMGGSGYDTSTEHQDLFFGLMSPVTDINHHSKYQEQEAAPTTGSSSESTICEVPLFTSTGTGNHPLKHGDCLDRALDIVRELHSSPANCTLTSPGSASTEQATSPAATPSTTPSPAPTRTIEQVLATTVPASINKYPLNSANSQDTSRMYAQVVLGELHLVLRLVKQLVAKFPRIEAGTSGPENKKTADDEEQRIRSGIRESKSTDTMGTTDTRTPGAEGAAGQIMPVLMEMEGFLLGQLKALARETTDMLRAR